MLLSDFDDVDRYLVDPSALFVNVKRFREIRANYLTEDQLRIIGRYWGASRTMPPRWRGSGSMSPPATPRVPPGASCACGRCSTSCIMPIMSVLPSVV